MGFIKDKRKIVCIIIFQFIFFCSTMFAKDRYKYEVAVCAIFQNEAPYLKEWIEFHKLVGVEHFYLFNHLSRDGFDAILAPYIKSGIVELIDWPYQVDDIKQWNRIQCEAYNHALELGRDKAKWMAFIDTDEFLFAVEVDTLTEFLANYKKEKGVVVNWQMYGTSNVQQLAEKDCLIENLIFKAAFDYPANVHVKSIIRPKYVAKFTNPHFCIFKKKYFAVDSNHEKVTGPYSSYVHIDKIRINHYWTRDENYFYNVKTPRQSNWNSDKNLKMKNELDEELDTTILKYLPKLKEKLHL